MPVKGVRENIVEEELVRRVRAIGGIAEKTTVIGRRGFFDRVVVLPHGIVSFVEVKKPKGGRLSKHQIMRAAAYRALQVDVAEVRTKAAVDNLLRRLTGGA